MRHMSLQLKRLVPLMAAVVLLSGCGKTTELKPFEPPVYPAKPDQPRFIYERTLMGSADVQAISTRERFQSLATGAPIGETSLIKPFDIAVKKGRVYVTDTVRRSVVMFDIANGKFAEFGTKGHGRLSKPIGLDVGPSGDVYVTDNTSKKVAIYDADGRFLRAFGGKKEMIRPTDVAVDADGRYAYVVDTGGVESSAHQVLKYDVRSGALVDRIGRRGMAEGDFNLPLMVEIDSKGRIYVLDSGNFRVQRFTPEGEFDFAFGKVGTRFGDFSRPKGLAIDRDDNVIVMDASFANFQIFNDKGELLLFIGHRGLNNEPGVFSLPAGITVDEDGRIYAVDQFFSKIEVFRPYGMKQSEGYAGVSPAKKQ